MLFGDIQPTHLQRLHVGHPEAISGRDTNLAFHLCHKQHFMVSVCVKGQEADALILWIQAYHTALGAHP